jgi:hypothetical protein
MSTIQIFSLYVSRLAESRTTRTNSGCGNSWTALSSIFAALSRPFAAFARLAFCSRDAVAGLLDR